MQSPGRALAVERSASTAALYSARAPGLTDAVRRELESELAGEETSFKSVLLGHSTMKVTERYYSPWVRARQEQLEADVRRS